MEACFHRIIAIIVWKIGECEGVTEVTERSGKEEDVMKIYDDFMHNMEDFFRKQE